jgi:hypothetical protein
VVHFTEYFPHLNSNSADQITCELSSLTLPTAAVGTSWSLLGSTRNGQAALYLFQKHSLCWEYIYTCSHCRRFLNGQTRLGGACAVLPKNKVRKYKKIVCEDGFYFLFNYLYTHGDGESEKKKSPLKQNFSPSLEQLASTLRVI